MRTTGLFCTVLMLLAASPASAQQAIYGGGAVGTYPYTGMAPVTLTQGPAMAAPGGAEAAAAVGQGGPMMMSGSGMVCPESDCDACEERLMPRWTAWGEFLYLRPRHAEVPFAVPFVAAPGVPLQQGPVAVADFDYEPAFRVGFGRAIDECSSLMVSYTYYDNDVTETVLADVFPLRALVTHPSADQDMPFTGAQAERDLRVQLFDLDYRHVFAAGNRYQWTYLLGVRYANFRERFGAGYVFGELLAETVDTNVNFDGGGIRAGLETEHTVGRSGFFFYGKGAANLVGGQMRAHYWELLGNAEVTTQLVNTGWKAGRVVSMLDLEVGFGWKGPSDHLRLSAGYMFSGWNNILTTGEWIEGVQANEFRNLAANESSTLTFDGLVARAEVRF